MEFYERARAQSQSEYEDAYRSWIAEMPEDERRRMAEMGLDEPDTDCPQINGKNRTAEDMDDVINIVAIKNGNHPSNQFHEDSAHYGDVAEALTLVFLDLITTKNQPLMIDAYASALGLYDMEGLTCDQLGQKHGCTRQRFSFVKTIIVDRFGLRMPNCKPREQRAEQRSGKDWNRFNGPAKNLSAWVNRKLDEMSPEEWPEVYRSAFIAATRPIAETYLKLTGRE